MIIYLVQQNSFNIIIFGTVTGPYLSLNTAKLTTQVNRCLNKNRPSKVSKDAYQRICVLKKRKFISKIFIHAALNI